jgi:hypothetical protein
MITDKPGIVIARPPKRATRKQPQLAIALPEGPEADAQVVAFFTRMIRPVGS